MTGRKKITTKQVISTFILIVAISLLIGSFSYAWLNGSFFSTDQVTINAGYLDLTFDASQNLINVTNALPQLDEDALDNNTPHTFTLTNNSTEDVGYIIKLENICTTGVDIDTCVPDEYIKAAISVDSGEYTTIALNQGNILTSGTIDKKASNATVKSYSLKVWLDSNTPNDYNKGTNNNINIAYQGKITIETAQQLGTLVTDLAINLGYTTITPTAETQATVSILPQDATNKNVTWSSSKPSIATITPSGIITSVAVGTTRICAVANDGSGIYNCTNLEVINN